MSRHVVVDGSNVATEGRSMPSLRQLNEAVLAYMSEHPGDLITVVVDATFGHRIAASEVAEFDAAVANNELVSPPAGAIGRGDAFVLSIAHKVGATILSNDSYQEFHGAEYDWLFEEGRLMGGKPVPHIGWVFVARTPVRGPVSRKAVKAKRARGGKADARGTRPSPLASQPMPVPKSPPPSRASKAESPLSTPDSTAELDTVEPAKAGRRRDGGRSRRGGGEVEASSRPTATPTAKADAGRRRADAAGEVAKADGGVRAPGGQAPVPGRGAFINEPLPFLSFVERHPIGSLVEATVDAYSSHGAYVSIDGARGYVPLRLMADPAPRAARDVVKLGETRRFVVASFNPSRRGIDLATPEMAPTVAIPVAEPVAGDRAPAKRRRRLATAEPEMSTSPTAKPTATDKPTAGRRAKAAGKRIPARTGSDDIVGTLAADKVAAGADRGAPIEPAAAPAGKRARPTKAPAASKVAPTKVAPTTAAPAPKVPVAPKVEPTKVAPTKAAPAPKAPVASKVAPTKAARPTKAPASKAPVAAPKAPARPTAPAAPMAPRSSKARPPATPTKAVPGKSAAGSVKTTKPAPAKMPATKVPAKKVAATKAPAAKAVPAAKAPASRPAAPSPTRAKTVPTTASAGTVGAGAAPAKKASPAKKTAAKATAKRPAR